MRKCTKLIYYYDNSRTMSENVGSLPLFAMEAGDFSDSVIFLLYLQIVKFQSDDY